MTYLVLVSRRCGDRKNIILDAASCKVVEDGMVGVDEHAAVVLDQGRSVQDGLAEEAGQTRRARQFLDSPQRSIVERGVLRFVKILEIAWDLG
jgi:hypothetical protein